MLCSLVHRIQEVPLFVLKGFRLFFLGKKRLFSAGESISSLKDVGSLELPRQGPAAFGGSDLSFVESLFGPE